MKSAIYRPGKSWVLTCTKHGEYAACEGCTSCPQCQEEELDAAFGPNNSQIQSEENQ